MHHFLQTCYTCTVLTCTGGLTAPKRSALHNLIPCQRLLEPNKPHLTIEWMNESLGFLIITIEWVV